MIIVQSVPQGSGILSTRCVGPRTLSSRADTRTFKPVRTVSVPLHMPNCLQLRVETTRPYQSVLPSPTRESAYTAGMSPKDLCRLARPAPNVSSVKRNTRPQAPLCPCCSLLKLHGTSGLVLFLALAAAPAPPPPPPLTHLLVSEFLHNLKRLVLFGKYR